MATVPASNLAFYITSENALQYNAVIINLGGVWSLTNNTATIAVPGIYYTVVSMDISCKPPTAFWLRVNGEKRV